MPPKTAPLEFEAKLVVLGDTGVGKTSIVIRLVEGRYHGGTMSTIGASFMIKKLSIGDTRLTLQIWDTAGQERFRSLAPMYYRGSAAAVLVFDVTRRDSFIKAQEWVQELKRHADDDCVLAIACNKVDTPPEQRHVSHDEGVEFANSVGAAIFDTSAKTNKGVDELFLSVARRLIERKQQQLGGGGAGGGGGGGAGGGGGRGATGGGSGGGGGDVKLGGAQQQTGQGKSGGRCC